MSGTYLLTGGAGFIGRQLCRELLAQQGRVRVLDTLHRQVHGDSKPALPREVAFITGDICDPATVAAALEGVDVVVHLAAEVGVGQSMYEVARYVGVNDLGTAVLLEQLIRRPVARLVVASSMSVYGEGQYCLPDGRPADPRDLAPRRAPQWDPRLADGTPLRPVPTAETKPVDLASIYALTKYAQERACLIVGRAYGIETVALRLFNVFGPGQALANPYTGVLANFGARLLNHQRPIVFEDGRQQRDFVHVADVARAFYAAAHNPLAVGEVINIGSGRAYPIARVARLLAEAMGRPQLEPEIVGKARAGDVRHCFADIAKAGALLGYAPRRPLEEAIGELADWIARCSASDGGERARRELEARGLVA